MESTNRLIHQRTKWTAFGGLLLATGLLFAACGEDDSAGTPTASPSAASQPTVDGSIATPTVSAKGTVAASTPGTFVAEVWADNWFALYVNGVLVGQDSVPITTERSFNAETITFEAKYPLTVAIEAKDFKETDSGLEYIGAANQQMGDGGIIAQITDTSTGKVIAVTSSDWSSLVIHRAPLNTGCEKDANPDLTCQFEATDAPANWTSAEFDDSGWVAATEWTAAAVSPKDGYNEISWEGSAKFIWGADLEVDNTVLLRVVVEL